MVVLSSLQKAMPCGWCGAAYLLRRAFGSLVECDQGIHHPFLFKLGCIIIIIFFTNLHHQHPHK